MSNAIEGEYNKKTDFLDIKSANNRPVLVSTAIKLYKIS
jgi:hypothetical protein